MQHDLRRVIPALIITFVLISITGCAPATPGVTVQGKVSSGESSLSDVTVSLKYDGETVETQTNSEGTFVFTGVGGDSQTISFTTTIEDRECVVTRTLLDSESASINADIEVPTNLSPPEVVAVGGVGYVAGDLNIICE